MSSNRSVEKIRFALLFLIAGLLQAAPTPPAASSGTVPANAVTLDEAYKRGLEVSETLKLREQDIIQLEQKYRYGLGAIHPRLTWNMTQLFQDTKGTAQGGPSGNQNPIRRRTPEAYFQLEQPLFHGFQEFNALKGFSASKRAAGYRKQQAALDLLVDVATVFYTALDLQLELDVLEEQRKLTNERLEELRRRVRLGRSRDSETLSSQVDLASLDAQVEDTRARWVVARETLWFLTEIPLDRPLTDARPMPALPTLDQAIQRGTARPDVRAAMEDQASAKYQLSYARAGYWPSLDLTASYYTERVGYYKPVNWDALFALEVPLYQGGQIRALSAEARSKQIAAELNYSMAQRQAKQFIETEHAGLRYNLAQTEAYGRAVELAQRNYGVQQGEYRLGLINNLQVLDVLTTLQNLKIRKIQAEAAARLSHIRLLAATGEGLSFNKD